MTHVTAPAGTRQQVSSELGPMISSHQYSPGPELAVNMNVSPNPLGTVYATKRRRRSNKRWVTTVGQLAVWDVS